MLTQIKAAGLNLSVAFTPESAVASCLGNHFAAVVLDAALIRNDDWSVAKSLKLVKPTLPILLLDPRDASRKKDLPENIDALACSDDPNDVLVKLKEIVIQKPQPKDALPKLPSTSPATGKPPNPK
jgi:hypothetical protein